MALADIANNTSRTRPWALAKKGKADEVKAVCTMGLNLFQVLVPFYNLARRPPWPINTRLPEHPTGMD